MNISFPFTLLLIPYGIVVLYVVVFSMLHIQHLAQYSTSRSTVKAVLYVWAVGFLGLLIMTGGLLKGTDWQHPVTISPPSYQADSQIDYGL